MRPSPVLPDRWFVGAFGCVVPHIRLDLDPGGGVVVWRLPGASGVRVEAWFPVGGCHPSYTGSVRVGRGVRLGTGS